MVCLGKYCGGLMAARKMSLIGESGALNFYDLSVFGFGNEVNRINAISHIREYSHQEGLPPPAIYFIRKHLEQQLKVRPGPRFFCSCQDIPTTN